MSYQKKATDHGQQCVSVLYAADIDNKAEVSCNQFIDQFCYVSAHGQFAFIKQAEQ